ncbi:MAG: BCD family MFS transporter [Chloroflexota bacterium]
MNWRKVVQLTMVHVGVSVTVVPVTSTLNRVMIADMHFSAFLVGLLISLPYLLSPIQVAIGNWADSHPLWGRFRSPWILIGGLLASFGSYFTAHAAFLMNTDFVPGLMAAIVAFTAWGLGVNIASVSYLSLISEISGENEGWRSRTISIMWTVMILSSILVSIMLSRSLTDFSQEALFTAFGAVWTLSTFLILFGSANIEGPNHSVTNGADVQSANPILAYRLLVENPSARRFFFYLLLVLVSIHAQDVLLEPFGGQVLEMDVSQTSRLTAIWGIGVLVTLVSGIYVIRKLGKKSCANIGAILAAIAFGFIIFSGLVKTIPFFQWSIFLLGLGGGLMTISNLSFMLEMTIPKAAGLYMGAWGVANFSGQALGTIASGLIRDVTYQLSNNVTAGYVIVFGLEIVGLVGAVLLFRRITVTRFREDSAMRLDQMLALLANP